MSKTDETPLDFEWDRTKAEENLRKHDLAFEVAILIFGSRTVIYKDARNDYGEERVTAIGKVGDECIVVVYTSRHGKFRIISAWRGGRRARNKLGQDDAGRS